MNVDKEPCDCAPAVSLTNDSFNVCSSDKTIEKIAKIVKVNPKNKEQVIEKAKDLTKCSSEICVLESNKIKPVIGHETVDKEIFERFKGEGPRDTTDLLSNFHIDHYLSQLKDAYPRFYHMPFQMIDFELTQSPLSKIDWKQFSHNHDSFGVIINTDTSRGRGIHWFSIYFDFKKSPMTLEYFNSSGRPPMPSIVRLLNKAKFSIGNAKIKCVSKFQHQTDDHSCGPYAIYYIHSRLTGIPYKYFKHNKITDDKMVKFRKHLFRK